MAPSHQRPLTHAPTWLMHRCRALGSTRHLIKIVAFITACVLVGYTVAGLYNHNLADARDLDPFGFDPSSEWSRVADLKAEDSERLSNQDTSGSRVTSLTTADGQSLHSIYHDVSSTLTRLGSWTKSSINRLTDASAKNGTVQTPGLEGEPSGKGEDVWGESSSIHGDRPLIGKVSIVFGGNELYERALRTHAAHNRLHNYQMFTLRQSILDDVWTKPAYILTVMLRELAKPEAERLQWLLWVDADTVILNPHIPSELFLPPRTPEWEHVHLLVTYDFNGLNNGVFPIRVHPWSVELLSAILAFRHYRPRADLTFRDQSAMAQLLQEPAFKPHVMEAPQRWYNAYRGELNETIAPFQFRRGDFLVHFAGDPERDAHMEYWLDRAEAHDDAWEVALKHTTYPEEVREFWAKARAERIEREAARKSAQSRLRTLIKGVAAALDQHAAKLDIQLVEQVRRLLDETRLVATSGESAVETSAIDEAYTKLKKDAAPVLDRATAAQQEEIKAAHTAVFDAEHLLFTDETMSSLASATKEHLQAQVGKLKEKLQNAAAGQTDEQLSEIRAATTDLNKSIGAATTSVSTATSLEGEGKKKQPLAVSGDVQPEEAKEQHGHKEEHQEQQHQADEAKGDASAAPAPPGDPS